MIETRLVPETDEFNQPFFDYTALGELRIQRCASCDAWRMPPGPRCGTCGSPEAAWERMSGQAQVWSFAVPHPPLLPAYSEIAPYAVVVVALAEDATVRLCGMAQDDPASVHIGMEVEVVFGEAIDGIVVPQWRSTGAE